MLRLVIYLMITTVALLLTLTGTARAQFDVVPAFDPMAAFWGSFNEENCGDHTTEGCGTPDEQEARGERGAAPVFLLPPVADAPPSVETRFAVDRQARRQAEEAYAAAIARIDPSISKQMPTGRIVRTVGQGIRPYGLRTDDLADAMTVYLVQLWMAANGSAERVPDEAVAAVRRQVVTLLAQAQDPRLQRASARQAEADALLLRSYLLSSLNMTTAQPGRGGERGKLREGMGQITADLFGTDFRRVALGASGLVPDDVSPALTREVGRSEDGDVAFCGHEVSDAVEAKILRFLSTRDLCSRYDPSRYAAFQAEVPSDQRYAVNFMAWSAGKPLFPAEQARAMDAMME